MLCFAAHPDDIDFGAAGTIAAWTAAGVQVSYCIMTDGDAGGFDPAHRAEIIALRAAEQRRAAELVGVTDIHYLHERDGYLEPSHEVMKGVVKLIREVRPDVVLAMHPERNWNRIQKSHPDHLAVGEAVTRAVYPAVENPFAYPELAEAGLAAYKLPWLWLYAGPEERENHFVDVTDHVDSQARRPSTSMSASIRMLRPWRRRSRNGMHRERPAGRTAGGPQRRGVPRCRSQRPGNHRRLLAPD